MMIKRILTGLLMIAVSAEALAFSHGGGPNLTINELYKMTNAQHKYNKANSRIVVYYTSWCPVCHKLMAKMDALGIHYTGINIDNKRVPGIRYVPVTVANGHRYVGDIDTRTLKNLARGC